MHLWHPYGVQCWTMKTPSFFYDNFYDKPNKVMTSYVRLCTLMKTVWINKVKKREVKSGYKILSLEIPTDYTVNAKDLFFWHFQPYHLIILPHTYSQHKYSDHRADYLVPQEVNYIHLNNDGLFCKS